MEYKHNAEDIDYRLEIFNMYFPNDYRTYHLKFSQITSAESLCDCYSYNDYEAVDLINKAISAAPNTKNDNNNKSIKSEFIKLYEKLNDLSAKNKMKVNLKWLEAIKSTKEGLTGEIDKLYERYFTSFNITNNYRDKYLLQTDDTNKNAIDQSYSFIKQHQNKLEQKKDKLQKYKNDLMDEYNEIEHKYLEPSNKIEFFHQCVIWILMIIAIIFSFADDSWDMVFLSVILTIILKGILKLTQWILEEIFYRKKKKLDIFFPLNKYDIFILEKYYSEYKNNINELQAEVEKKRKKLQRKYENKK